MEKAPVDVDGDGGGEFSPDEDALLADAIRIVVETETASVSMIQAAFRVISRAASSSTAESAIQFWIVCLSARTPPRALR